MKLSVSVSDDDVEFIDRYAHTHDVSSRSAVVQQALAVLRAAELGDQYVAAWAEWDDGDAGAWGVTVGDGLPDRPVG